MAELTLGFQCKELNDSSVRGISDGWFLYRYSMVARNTMVLGNGFDRLGSL
jgi:hypothetical protein